MKSRSLGFRGVDKWSRCRWPHVALAHTGQTKFPDAARGRSPDGRDFPSPPSTRRLFIALAVVSLMFAPWADLGAQPAVPNGPAGKRARVPTPKAGEPSFTFTVLKYGGGGDWYEGLVGAPLFLEFLHKEAGLSVWPEVEVMEPGDPNLFRRRFLYMTGHGEVRFSPAEGAALKAWLLGGGFLFANDDYGMDPAFRREMARLFPGKEWVRLGPGHPIFQVYFPFPQGLPKIHEHDGGPAQALALFEGSRMLVLYTFDSDIGDGWAPPEVHGDPPEKRLEAFKFGVNVVLWAMTGR